MRAVNLLPPQTHSRRDLRGIDTLMVAAVVITVVVVAAIGGGFELAHSHSRFEQRQLDAARAALTQLQARQSAGQGATPSLAAPSVASQEQPWRQALSTALATRVAWDHTLAELAHVTPPQVTLTNVTLGGTSGSGTSSASGATTFQLSGNAYSNDGVAQLLSRLMLVPDLSQIALTSTTTDPKTGIVTFQIGGEVAASTTAFTTTTAGGAA